jgi:hypothetical protein
MDDKRYAKRALILALTAFTIASFPITIPILTMFVSIGFNVPLEGYLKFTYGFLIISGWIPGLVLAIIAHKMGKRMKGTTLLINTTRITAVLAFLGNLGFGIFLILALLINHYFPANF